MGSTSGAGSLSRTTTSARMPRRFTDRKLSSSSSISVRLAMERSSSDGPYTPGARPLSRSSERMTPSGTAVLPVMSMTSTNRESTSTASSDSASPASRPYRLRNCPKKWSAPSSPILVTSHRHLGPRAWACRAWERATVSRTVVSSTRSTLQNRMPRAAQILKKRSG